VIRGNGTRTKREGEVLAEILERILNKRHAGSKKLKKVTYLFINSRVADRREKRGVSTLWGGKRGGPINQRFCDEHFRGQRWASGPRAIKFYPQETDK